MKNILFPTDFSDNANHALKYAVDFALKTGSNLVILNCYAMPSSTVGVMKSIKDILRQDSEAGMRETEAYLKTNYPQNLPSYQMLSRYGNLVNNIREIVKSHNTDMVIIGTIGATGLRSVVIGSNAVDVVRNINCPVLVVPDISTFKDVTKIVLAADLHSLSNEKTLIPLLELARLFSAHIEILNIIKPEEDISVKQKEREKLSAQMAGIDHSFVYEENDDIVEGINNYLHRSSPELLSMILRKHNLFAALFRPSITRDIAIHPTVPVMVLHE